MAHRYVITVQVKWYSWKWIIYRHLKMKYQKIPNIDGLFWSLRLIITRSNFSSKILQIPQYFISWYILWCNMLMNNVWSNLQFASILFFKLKFLVVIHFKQNLLLPLFHLTIPNVRIRGKCLTTLIRSSKINHEIYSLKKLIGLFKQK